MGYLGVITNACIMAFTYRSQSLWSPHTALIVAFVAENIIFALKWFIAATIPDVPEEVKYAQAKKKLY